jgi:hydrogenase nickel incorporation protein HypA/HybF
MHEVSIATGLIDELIRIAEENEARKVITVNVKIGKMSGIVTDSLKFAFDALKAEQPLISSTEMQIQEVPLCYECRDCRVTFGTEDPNFPCCPDCKSYRLTLLTGEEMNIENMEIEV